MKYFATTPFPKHRLFTTAIAENFLVDHTPILHTRIFYKKLLYMQFSTLQGQKLKGEVR